MTLMPQELYELSFRGGELLQGHLQWEEAAEKALAAAEPFQHRPQQAL